MTPLGLDEKGDLKRDKVVTSDACVEDGDTQNVISCVERE